MKILAFSDIHNNISCVRKLCSETLSGDYDLIIVAGDIGHDIAEELFSLLTTFDCPIYYVYGNWDYEFSYESCFVKNSFHLHHNMQSIGGYYFIGFSGCDANWGNNPIKIKLYDEVNENHRNILSLIELCEENIEKEKNKIILRYNEKIKKAGNAKIDKRSKAFKQKIKRINNKKDIEVEGLWTKMEKLKSREIYKKYIKDKRNAYNEVTNVNRDELACLIKDSGVDPKKLIVVTHDRFFRLAEYFSCPPIINLFGHKHGFKHTVFKDSHYINVSVLDRLSLVIPHCYKADDYWVDDVKKINSGNYCVIKIDDNGSVNSEKMELSFDCDKWKPAEMNNFDEIDIMYLKDECDFIPEEEVYNNPVNMVK